MEPQKQEKITKKTEHINKYKKNYILKIVMLGDCAVGKTSII